MTNTNCLEDIQCPACGNEESFRIAATTIVTVTDDGTDDPGDMEWDDESYAECAGCFRHGTLKDFEVTDRDRIPDKADAASVKPKSTGIFPASVASALLASLKGTLYALDESRDGPGPSKQTAITNALAAIAEAETAGITPAPGEVALKSYSVLLLYPDYYLNDFGSTKTYYTFVEAPDPIEAVAVAQRQAATTQIVEIDDPTDFAPLLVTEGHHASEPL